MSLQNNPQSFFPQNGTSVRPTGGAFPMSFPPGAQPATASYNLLDHPSNDVQDLIFARPAPIPWQDDQPGMPGQPIGTGPMPILLMKEQYLGTGAGTASLYPPSRSNPRAIHDNHHAAGVSLGMNTVEHNPFPVPEHYQAPPRNSDHQYRKAPARHHMRTRVTLHPFSTISYRKQPRPAATFVANVIQVQAQCAGTGGDPAAIGLLPVIFVDGITQKALTRQLTNSEACDYHNGSAGQVYRVLLRVDEDERFHCRLCAIGADEGGWKHAKDALRHLKRDHFGLGTHCDRCHKVAYTAAELKRHHCVVTT